MICKMASTDFNKAVVEAGYTDDYYTSSHYKRLDFTIEKLCREL